MLLLNNEQLNMGGGGSWRGKAEWKNMTSNKMYNNSLNVKNSISDENDIINC